MNLRDIEYILKSYETGRFAQASKLCHISQPSLSIQIKKIEQELGRNIFIRHQNGVSLTEFGQEILPYFQEIQKNVERIKNHSSKTINNTQPTVRLGAIFTVAPYIFPHIRTLKNIAFEESNTKELLSKLLNDQLDAAIMALPIKTSVFTTRKILREPFYLAAAKKNRLAKKVDLDTMTFPENCQLAALTDEHCLSDQVKDICHLFGNQRKRFIEKTSLETIRRLIASSDYITLMPKMAKSANDGLQYRQLPAKYYRDIGMIYKKNSVLEEHILSIFEELKTSLGT